MTLISKKYSSDVKVICAADRYAVVKLGMVLLINVYLPCAGTDDRLDVCEEVLDNLSLVISEYPNHHIIFGGDLNVDLYKYCSVSVLINDFLNSNSLLSCDLINYDVHLSTYYNEYLGHASNVDYILVSDFDSVMAYAVLDPDINLSDHRPIVVYYDYTAFSDCGVSVKTPDVKCRTRCVPQLRWDHANLDMFRNITDVLLRPLYNELMHLDLHPNISVEIINDVYDRLICILRHASDLAVPVCRKNFFKHWWDVEMKETKDRSVASSKIWKEAGRPRSGPISEQYRKDKAVYKREVRTRKQQEKEVYTNELHEALLKKEGRNFWNCWSSKFGSSEYHVTCVDGSVDEDIIAEQFAQYFSKVCANNTTSGSERLAREYRIMRSQYVGELFNDCHLFDAELVHNVITNMKRGKAAGLDGIMTEHLQCSHYVLPCILAKLFNLMLIRDHVPPCFGQSCPSLCLY